MEIESSDKEVREEFSRRLSLACDKADIKLQGRQAQISSALGVSPKAVSKWFNAESIPRRTKLLKLAEYVGADLNWLLAVDVHLSANKRVSDCPPSEHFRVEIHEASCLLAYQTPAYIADAGVRAIEFTSEYAKTLFNNLSPTSVKFLIINGDSMSPTLEPGDLIYVDITCREITNDGVYAFYFGDTLYVKRLEMKKNRIVVFSDNPLYCEWHIHAKDQRLFSSLGRIILIQRSDLKRL